jgi:hypothetical protein
MRDLPTLSPSWVQCSPSSSAGPVHAPLIVSDLICLHPDAHRPMQPKFYGTFYAAAVSITAIVGAFMGLVIARTMDIEGMVKDNFYKVGPAPWCLVLGAT